MYSLVSSKLKRNIFSAVLSALHLSKFCLLSFADPGVHSDPTFINFGLFLWRLLGYITWILTKPCFFFCSVAYEDDVDNLHSYWREYFKVFHIVPKKVCNFYLLLSKVDVFWRYFQFVSDKCQATVTDLLRFLCHKVNEYCYSPRSVASLS